MAPVSSKRHVTRIYVSSTHRQAYHHKLVQDVKRESTITAPQRPSPFVKGHAVTTFRSTSEGHCQAHKTLPTFGKKTYTFPTTDASSNVHIPKYRRFVKRTHLHMAKLEQILLEIHRRGNTYSWLRLARKTNLNAGQKYLHSDRQHYSRVIQYIHMQVYN
jgi:acyl-CoA synthetase (NDP forming)